MATFINVDDIHANIKITSGLCPEDPVTIIVDNYLGGGGNPNNYYYNWFQKDSVDTNVYVYNSTACLPNLQKRVDFGPFIHPTYFAIDIPGLVFLDYGVATPVATVLTDVANALQGFGRTVTTSGTTITLIMRDDDPQSVAYECGAGPAWIDYHIAPLPAFPAFNGVTTLCCGSAVIAREIVGWIPLAGGVNVDTFIVPSNTGIYMVEVVDEVGTPDYGVIDLNILIPACGFTKTNVSCAGKNDGSLVVLPFFDNSVGITFAWTKDEVEYSNQKDIYNLAPGTYCLTMTNSNGCQRTCCETIIEPLPLELTVIRQTNPSCVSCRNSTRFGELLVEITGGNIDCADACNSSYEYSLDGKSWSKVDFDNRILLTRLTEGSYKLYVRDCKCCFAFHEFIIEEQKVEIS